jgi:hypothetical protein
MLADDAVEQRENREDDDDEQADLDLVDEYRLFVNPVTLGGGTRYFASLSKRLNLELVETRTVRLPRRLRPLSASVRRRTADSRARLYRRYLAGRSSMRGCVPTYTMQTPPRVTK